MLSLQHSHGYSGSFLNYITMDNRFLDLIERSMKEHWDLPAFSDYNGHTFHFKDVARRIEKFHILLEHAGIKKGDKVAIVGRNSSNWAICFFGILAYGAVAVPILHEFKPDNIHHIVNHSGAKAVLAGSSNWENMNEKMMPDVKLFMMLDNFSIIDCKNKEVRTIRDRINEYFGKKYPRSFTANDVKYHIEDPEELAVLNYTSGTTSFSKGVMIPYRSLWSNTQFAYDRLPFIHPGDNIVCMLPMAHMYGLAFEVLNSVNKGCHVHFLTRTPSPKIIAEAFATVRPALILAVPLIIEKIIKNKVFPELEKPLIKLLLKVPYIDQKVREKIAQKLEGTAVDMLELNISCPNVKQGGAAFGTSCQSAADITAKVRKATAKPLMVKLSPNVTSIADIAKAVEAEGADAVSLINTVLGMRIDIKTRRPILKNNVGGLSGPAVFPIAVRMVWQVANAVKIPVVGMGGISKWEDAVEMLLAGASALQIGAAIFSDPYAPLKVIDGLNQYMDEQHIQKVADLVGQVHPW